jgi:hypothetical protein
LHTLTFSHCKSLKTLRLPASVLSVEKWTFDQALTTLILEGEKNVFHKWAFPDHSKLSKVIVPKGSANRYREAFNKLSDVKNVEIVEATSE